MKVRIKKSYKNRLVREIVKEEYTYTDIVDADGRFTTRDKPYIDFVLRKRLKHIKYKEHTKPRGIIIYGMACSIFFEYIKMVVEELIKGNEIVLHGMGTLRLRTRNHSFRYTGWSKDRKISKSKGFYTGIEMYWEKDTKRFKNGRPYFSFGSAIKERIRKNEDKGIKY